MGVGSYLLSCMATGMWLNTPIERRDGKEEARREVSRRKTVKGKGQKGMDKDGVREEEGMGVS